MSTVHFPSWARLALGVIVGVVSYLVVGDLHASESTLGLVAALIALLGSAGVVPPTIDTLPVLSPQLRFILTGAVTVGTYFLTTANIENTLQAIIVAVLAFAASVGIVPAQANAS